MRITANVQRPQKQVRVQGVPLPAPVGGWDAISPLANMPVDRAVQLDNWVCRPGWIEPRGGFVARCTGLGVGDPVETVMAYNGDDGTVGLFGVAGGNIFNCSLPGTAVLTNVTGLGSSRLQYVMFANPAGQYLMTVNGVDNPWSYDGTNWAQLPITIGNATGSIVWRSNFVPTERIVLNGTVVEFVSSSPTGNQVLIGSTLAISLANLLTFLNASADPNIVLFTYSVVLGTTLLITAVTPGVDGNALTLAAGYATGSIVFSVNPSNGDTITLAGTVIEFVTNFATGYIFFSANPSNNDTITLDGTVVKFVTSGATGNQVNIGASLSATLTSLLTLLTGSADPGLVKFSYSVSSGTTLQLQAKTGGPTGDLLTLAASAATPSGPFLTGGQGAGTNQVNISSTLANTMAALLAVLQSSGDPGVEEFTFAVASGTTLNIQASSAGILGNSLSISASVATPSGTFLTGGSTAGASGSTLTGGGDNHGIAPSDFVTVQSYANRLWFVPVNSTSVVYLQNIGGVQGAASVFPLGQLFRRGGYVMAIGTWTIDTRQTVDEYIAFISSRGEVAVYQGTDPTTAPTFALVGLYQVGAPIGRRCFLRISGDLQIITVDGVVGMSEMLSTDRAAANRVSLTSIIMNEVALASAQYKNNFGWQLTEYALGTLAILNIPMKENQQQMQFVMNTITGAWSRFIGLDPTGAVNQAYGINANCWEVDGNDNVFFGDNNGTVWQWNVGSGDGPQPITCVAKGAYNSFGNAAQLKRYTSLQALITSGDTVVPAIGINVDFNDSNVLSSEEDSASSDALWNSVNWDSFTWAGGVIATNNWQSVQGVGHYVSIVTQITTQPSPNNPSAKVTLQLNGWNILAESGAFI